jgi:sugar lactone lactonase YvrE
MLHRVRRLGNVGRNAVAKLLGCAVLVLAAAAQAQIITEFSAGTRGNAQPDGITAGPDGNLWFTEFLGNRIGRITPAGVVTEFNAGISPNAAPLSITAGPDGNLWFTEQTGNQIGRITPAGVVTEFSAGISAGAYPFAITAGPDGNVWFTEGSGNRIGRITPAGVITEFGAGITANAGVDAITVGPDGNLWFTEFNTSANRIGRITVPPPLATLENPQPGSFQSGIGLISGWSCQGPSITVSIDGQPAVPLAYGSPRADTASVCRAGNTNSGFGLLLNFNTLGSGQHSAQLYVNGAARGNAAQFTVLAPAGEFLTGQSKQITAPDFPVAGRSTVLIWQESQQNFAVQSVSP